MCWRWKKCKRISSRFFKRCLMHNIWARILWVLLWFTVSRCYLNWITMETLLEHQNQQSNGFGSQTEAPQQPLQYTLLMAVKQKHHSNHWQYTLLMAVKQRHHSNHWQYTLLMAVKQRHHSNHWQYTLLMAVKQRHHSNHWQYTLLINVDCAITVNFHDILLKKETLDYLSNSSQWYMMIGTFHTLYHSACRHHLW